MPVDMLDSRFAPVATAKKTPSPPLSPSLRPETATKHTPTATKYTYNIDYNIYDIVQLTVALLHYMRVPRRYAPIDTVLLWLSVFGSTPIHHHILVLNSTTTSQVSRLYKQG
jgi:hypothetical protein